MATDKDVQDARRTGEQAGFQEAIQQLRSFTGVRYHGDHGLETLAPDLKLPEHLAYPRYRKDLAALERQLEHETERMKHVVEDTRQKLDATEDQLATNLEERRVARSGNAALVRAAGWVRDQGHPLRTQHKNLEQLWTRRRDHWSAVIADHRKIRDELSRVDEWLTTTAEQIAAAEDQRATDIENARVEAAAARRDSSPRWCTVLTREEFIAGDERRQARAWQGSPVVAGADFGYDWRRDSDDVGGRGIWTLHWIPETQETFFEANDDAGTIWILGTGVKSMEEALALYEPLERRQRERNSVGLVLDAYGTRFGPDEW